MELVVIGGGISGALISHALVEKGIEETQGYAVNYPMIGDPTVAIAKLYDMLPAEEPGTSEGRTAATNQTVRKVCIIGPDKKIKLLITYPINTGRNLYEILRVLDSILLTASGFPFSLWLSVVCIFWVWHTLSKLRAASRIEEIGLSEFSAN